MAVQEGLPHLRPQEGHVLVRERLPVERIGHGVRYLAFQPVQGHQEFVGVQAVSVQGGLKPFRGQRVGGHVRLDCDHANGLRQVADACTSILTVIYGFSGDTATREALALADVNMRRFAGGTATTAFKVP